MTGPAPAAVLLDADGVMQANPPGWRAEVAAVVAPSQGEDFLADLFASEQEAMVGRAGFVDVLGEVCRRWGVADQAGDLLRQWRRVEVSAAMVALVHRLRAAGTPCHLVSNQNDVRAAFLRDACGYGELFDSLFLSCDLGALKVDAAFWRRVLQTLGLPPGSLLVIDDGEKYVAAARRSGLRAERWTLDDGLPRLEGALARHGVVVTGD